MTRKPGKRIRLVEAAKILIHQQGFNLTTLADIAQLAGVPLGNVYYYFKTKEAIGIAVIANWSKELHERLMHWDAQNDGRGSLLAFIDNEVMQAESIARHGCAVGALCQELAKQGGPMSTAASVLLSDMIEWVDKQFKRMGFEERSRELSLQFVSTVEGMALLTNTFREPRMMTHMKQQLITWLDTLVLSRSKQNQLPSQRRSVELEDAVV